MEKPKSKFWNILEKNGFIYKDVYEGWYAVRDEAFYGADEIVDGKAPTGAEVTWHREESYFFRLSAFQDKLLMLYEAASDFIRPTTVPAYLVGWYSQTASRPPPKSPPVARA
jgi:methionyl-tRNA synthetase